MQKGFGINGPLLLSASANAVAGNELAKILVQGISKLKNLVLKYMELFLMVPQRPEKCGRYWV